MHVSLCHISLMFVFESVLTALKKEDTGSTQAVSLSSSSSCDSSEEESSDAMSDSSSTASSLEEDNKKKRRKKKGKGRKSKKSKKMKPKARKRGKICYMLYFHPFLLTGFLVWSCLVLLYNCSSLGWFFSYDVMFCV